MQNHLVIGYKGEVGSAIFNILHSEENNVHGVDKDYTTVVENAWLESFDVIHVCIGFSSTFVETVKEYYRKFAKRDALLIIHSTVPIGTTMQFGTFAVHSPIRGVHPFLERGIRTMVKYFGGPRCQDAGRIFRELGIEIWMNTSTRNTEALKLWDTTYYGWNIIFQRAVKQFCEQNKLNYDLIYSHANHTYNEGYQNLGRNDVQRPVLGDYAGPIGGHCVIPNAKLIQDEPSGLADFLVQFDEQLNAQ